MDKETGNGAKPVLIVAVGHDELRRLLLAAFDFSADRIDVVTAASAQEAFERTENMSVNGVLMDISLAESGGLEMLAKFRADRPHLALIVIADGRSHEVHEMCLEIGVALYFERPVQLSAVASKVQTLLQAEGVGFRGSLQDLTLPDILQLLCEYEQSVQLRLISDEGAGTIVLENGEIVHAQTKDTKGEDAFLEICLWNGGSFELVHVLRPENKSILVPRPKLLMDAATVLAEYGDKRSVTGWYSVSGFQTRRPSEPARAPVPSPQGVFAGSPSSHYIDGSHRGHAGGIGAGSTAQHPPPSNLSDGPGPVIPSEMMTAKPPRIRAVPLSAQIVVYAVMLGVAGWTTWQWKLSREAAENLAEKTEEAVERPQTIAHPTYGFATPPEEDALFDVRIAPLREFRESGSMIVASKDVFDALGLASNAWIVLRGPTGVRLGTSARQKQGVTPRTVYVRGTIAKALKLHLSSPARVYMEPFTWSEGPVKEEPIEFSVSRTLPDPFAESLYAAGVGVDVMRKARMSPGSYAIVKGTGGYQSVRIQLMDRGNPDEIWLSKTVREALGLSGKVGRITLLPKNES